MPYIVQTATARMPNSCWGRYGRVAVLEIEKNLPTDYRPAMIAARAKGVVRIVETWERCNIGKTRRCSFRKALVEANDLAARLNAGK